MIEKRITISKNVALTNLVTMTTINAAQLCALFLLIPGKLVNSTPFRL